LLPGALPPPLSPLVRGLHHEFDNSYAKILAACDHACKESSVELGTAKEPSFDHDLVDQSILLAAGPTPLHHEDIIAADDISTKLDFIENFKEVQGLDLKRKRSSSRRAAECENQDHGPAKKRK